MFVIFIIIKFITTILPTIICYSTDHATMQLYDHVCEAFGENKFILGGNKLSEIVQIQCSVR